MQLRTGTSGYSYPAWKGPFYPEDAKPAEFLALYAARLPTVEINNTFYRLPKPEVTAQWAATVPPEFVFVIKASQRITHRARLRECKDTVDYLWQVVQPLGDHLGPILFQLPPNLRADAERLKDFVATLPEGMRAVFEFRHESWRDEAIHQILREAGCALCCADQDDAPEPEIVPTADFGYLRLRRAGYDEAALRAWAERIAAQPWTEAFAFLKHEDQGAAPRDAARLAAAFAAG